MESTSLLSTVDCRLPTPLPQIDINVRPATMEDLSFIDGLQKKHSKQLGFFPRAQMEGYINNGWMLIAESAGERVGYCASRDRYLKRDELGAVFQLCIEPGKQRGLIGANLLKAVFERASYGTKLFCCWCAQDLDANHFWEAMGFIPLAFRAGSREKSRVHIFWQKRIRAGDTTTPWWFPSQTSGGSIREDRLVLPIPPGTKWSDEMPRILPAQSNVEGPKQVNALPSTINNRTKRPPTVKKPTVYQTQFGPPSTKPIEPEKVETPKERPKKQKVKNDPKFVAAARELRDRYLEQVNEQVNDDLPARQGGKYEVSRKIEAAQSPQRLLRAG